MQDLIQDLRFAFRQLRTSPGFALVAILSLALGIGATCAVFSVVYGVLVNPYPYADSDRMVHLVVKDKGGNPRWISFTGPQLQQFRKANSVESVSGMDEWNLTTTGADLPEVPQPRLAALGPLLEQVRGAGLEVALRVEGDAVPLSPSVELSAYRIVQEALTNVLKHADATHADVRLHYRGRSLEIEVFDNGTGAATNTPGHGLIGMRERAALYGGTLITGRSADGGFFVAAELPLEGTAS